LPLVARPTRHDEVGWWGTCGKGRRHRVGRCEARLTEVVSQHKDGSRRCSGKGNGVGGCR
jgi:hypothetical protein